MRGFLISTTPGNSQEAIRSNRRRSEQRRGVSKSIPWLILPVVFDRGIAEDGRVIVKEPVVPGKRSPCGFQENFFAFPFDEGAHSGKHGFLLKWTRVFFDQFTVEALAGNAVPTRKVFIVPMLT